MRIHTGSNLLWYVVDLVEAGILVSIRDLLVDRHLRLRRLGRHHNGPSRRVVEARRHPHLPEAAGSLLQDLLGDLVVARSRLARLPGLAEAGELLLLLLVLRAIGVECLAVDGHQRVNKVVPLMMVHLDVPEMLPSSRLHSFEVHHNWRLRAYLRKDMGVVASYLYVLSAWVDCADVRVPEARLHVRVHPRVLCSREVVRVVPRSKVMRVVSSRQIRVLSCPDIRMLERLMERVLVCLKSSRRYHFSFGRLNLCGSLAVVGALSLLPLGRLYLSLIVES